jgi:hypothetical protein
MRVCALFLFIYIYVITNKFFKEQRISRIKNRTPNYHIVLPHSNKQSTKQNAQHQKQDEIVVACGSSRYCREAVKEKLNTKDRYELEEERSVTSNEQVTSKEQPELLSKEQSELLSKEQHATSKEGSKPSGKEGLKEQTAPSSEELAALVDNL